MTITDIATEAAKLVENGDATLLGQCARRAVDEVAAEYFPLVRTETRVPKNGAIDFGDFTFLPRRIYAVTCRGKAVAYTYTADGLTVSETRLVRVTYAYLPPVGDEAIVSPSVPLRTLAYGTAAEYCLLSGLYDDAALWDKRFRDSLVRLNRRGRRLPQRRWL